MCDNWPPSGKGKLESVFGWSVLMLQSNLKRVNIFVCTQNQGEKLNFESNWTSPRCQGSSRFLLLMPQYYFPSLIDFNSMVQRFRKPCPQLNLILGPENPTGESKDYCAFNLSWPPYTPLHLRSGCFCLYDVHHSIHSQSCQRLSAHTCEISLLLLIWDETILSGLLSNVGLRLGNYPRIYSLSTVLIVLAMPWIPHAWIYNVRILGTQFLTLSAWINLGSKFYGVRQSLKFGAEP